MSATFQVQPTSFSATQRQLLQLANPNFQQELLKDIGTLIECQTQPKAETLKAKV